MKLMAGVLAIAVALFAPATASAQDGNQDLKKKLLEEIAKKLDEEMKRILEEISKLIDEEIAKARGQKPADRPAAPAPGAPAAKTGFLGVVPDQEQPEAEDFEAWKVEGGIRVNVMPQGPAEKSGLQDGDVIVAVEGTKIVEWTDLLGAMRSRKPGDKVKIKVMRGKESKEIAVTLGERPAAPPPPMGDEPEPAPAPEAKPPGERPGRLGLQPGEPTGKGLQIVDVSPDTPAQKAGILAGDVLVKLNDTAIWKTSDLQGFMDKAKAGQKVEVTVLRDGAEKKFSVVLIPK